MNVIMVEHGCSELTTRKKHCADRGFGHIEIKGVGNCCVCQHFLRQQKQHSCANVVLVGRTNSADITKTNVRIVKAEEVLAVLPGQNNKQGEREI